MKSVIPSSLAACFTVCVCLSAWSAPPSPPAVVASPGAAIVASPGAAIVASPGAAIPAETFGSKLQITVDRSKVNLPGHRMVVRMNRPAKRIELKVLDDMSAPLSDESVDLEGKAAQQDITLTWNPSSDAAVGRIELMAYDVDDNWVGVAIVPWALTIPHEEVHFATDKADIAKTEVPKLQDSLASITAAVEKYKELGRIQLFIAGHTDTVGTAAYNLDLSRRRARSIASWFVDNGLSIGVAYEGFGESNPIVKTDDNVDEAANRRVDYILSVEPPSGKDGSQPGWRYLKQPK
jgi:outer membrane protein OmpA-like peptidoglycan-associated protein